MIYDLRNEYRLQAFKERVNKLYEERAVVELTKVNPTRTLAQNNYLFLLLGYFGLQTGYTTDDVKEAIFKRTVNADIFKREMYVKEVGKNVDRWRSTKELNTAEMTLAIERFRNWSVAIAGIYLPDANEQGFILNVRTMLEQAKEYIAIPN